MVFRYGSEKPTKLTQDCDEVAEQTEF